MTPIRFAPRVISHITLLSLLCCYLPNAFCFTNGGRIFWSNSGNNILSALPDGTDIVQIVHSQGNIGNFDVDPKNRHVYWSTATSVMRSDFDGSNIMKVVQIPGSQFPGDMSLDIRRNQLFFSDGRNHIIYRSNLDGSDISMIKPAFGSPSNGGLNMWLDEDTEKLYWRELTLKRSDLDGTNVESFFTPFFANDFEVDSAHERVYWITSSGIRTANLDGSQPKSLFSGGLQFALGIGLDIQGQRAFYTDTWASGPRNYDGTIRIVNFDGTENKILINVGPDSLVRPFDIKYVNIVPEPCSIGLLSVLSWFVARFRGINRVRKI